MRRRARSCAAPAWTIVVLLAGCSAEEHPGPDPPAAPGATALFSEAATASGLDFVHENGMSGELYIAEVMGSGVGLLDYDNDGDLDVYLVQGGPLGEAAAARRPRGDRLYRNELAPGGGADARLVFTDVTESSGIAPAGYGMGVATGDFDNDGWTDLYVTGLGPNQLYRNQGDGTFVDSTAAAGVDDPRWSVSATFLDYDADGWLDLYVVNYVDFTPANNKQCRSLTGTPDYCGPLSFNPQGDRLFRNRGDGTFEDVTAASGVGGAAATGLGVAAGDYDGDGREEIYVANDGMPNFHWVRGTAGRFTDQAMASGTALSGEGQAEAGMGLAAGDYDADGDEDILVTHLAQESNTLYRNDGGGLFGDGSIASRLAAPSWAYTGFGTAWLDFDNDGWLDLAAVNGEVKKIPELSAAGDPYPLHMPNHLYRNLGGGRFEDVTGSAGEGFGLSEVSRGLAAGDLDNDGDVDLVVSNNRGPARLFRNQVGHRASWLGLRLVGTPGRRDMLGSWVGVRREGAPSLWRRVRTGGSYLSASDPRLLFGLGASPRLEEVLVRWPDGTVERFAAEPGGYRVLEQATGAPWTEVR